MQSGALMEPNRQDSGEKLQRDFVVGQSFEKRSPGSRCLFNLSAQRIAIRSDFFGCCGTKGGFER
jgi:hypothetical protein